jgi:hypothetical protein
LVYTAIFLKPGNAFDSAEPVAGESGKESPGSDSGCKNIYESIIGRLRKTAPSVTVPSLLSDGVILSKESINTLYTQEGWDRYVKNEIEIAIKNPVIIDWVTGKSDIGNVVMDEKK